MAAVFVDAMVRPERFELPTAWFVARYSIQLSYGRICIVWLCVLPRVLPRSTGRQASLPFDVMVRPERFELPTAWFVARYSIQLSYGRIYIEFSLLIPTAKSIPC